MTDDRSPSGQTLGADFDKRFLEAAVKEVFGGAWSDARKRIDTGKVFVNGERVLDRKRPVRAGDVVELKMAAPKPAVTRMREIEEGLVVAFEAAFVVVNKPAGISTVPYGDEPHGEQTLDALVREVLSRRDSIRGRAPLGVVHRIDKPTSGLLVFARTLAAKKHLGQQLRDHSMKRSYLALAHGDVRAQTFRSHLVEDRGDRLRGSARHGRREGQLAITHVEPVKQLRGATLVRCRLETGRTHQIRIHLSEAGHPLLGEAVYIRDYKADRIPAPRLMLHAAELGFVHPVSENDMHYEVAPPRDFQETLARL